ncbi:MAG: ABC transporter permease [Roseiflexus sp.]|nr:ABC transporter permease [Roseiflexus sp.]MCS7290726.1 ABC transporter permease [Roseiflexus sp.]MDW8233712.1 ABC transporter permease [Roseiflexaceae bacterium]
MALHTAHPGETAQVRRRTKSPLQRLLAHTRYTLAFTTKELLEIVQQPVLIAILLLGPLLIVLVFGFTYQGTQARLRAILVLPPDQPAHYPVADIERAAKNSFASLTTMTDRQQALNDLRAGKVDVVEIWSESLDDVIVGKTRIPIEFQTNLINPFVSGYAQVVAYGQINEINEAILATFFERSKAELKETERFLQEAQAEIGSIRADLAVIKTIDIERLKTVETYLEQSLQFDLLFSSGMRKELTELRDNIRTLRDTVEHGRLEAADERLAEASDRITQLRQQIQALSAIPADVIIAPLEHTYTNIAEVQPAAAAFFAPRLIALMMQHWAITLAALSLVRERLAESIEMYRISPISPLHMIVGKSLGLILVVAALTALLVLITMLSLDVPFLGAWWRLALEALLLIVSALGIGFVISALVTTDSQAVQLSMLILLLSIFFSGFLLLLDSFMPVIDVVSNIMPLKHGLILIENEFFINSAQMTIPIAWLSGLALAGYAGAWWLTRRQFGRH